MTADRERSERDPLVTPQQVAGLRAGYPRLAGAAPVPPDPPAAIVERQQRLRGALTEIHAFRPVPTATVAPDALPVTEEALDEWIAEAPAERKGLHREVARALAFLETFRR